MVSWLTYLDKVVLWDPTHIVFYNTYLIDASGVRIKTYKMGKNIVFTHLCSANTTYTLVSDTNPNATMTKSILDIYILVLREATLIYDTHDTAMTASRSGLANIEPFPVV